MLSFTPSQKIENRLKILQGLLAETYKDLEALSPDETKYIHRCAFISNIGASTRIENAVLTDQEIEWIDTTLNNHGKATAFEEKKSFILDKLSNDKERSVEEVVGCRQVLTTVYLQADELFPLSEVTIRGLHHDLLRYYPKASSYAGGYKTAPNRVVSINHETGEKRVVLAPSPPGIITATAMTELTNWYNTTIQDYPWAILVAAEFVFRFLAIHPFQDGNGRLGRALFILALFHSGDKYLTSITPYIAIDRHIEQNHTLYYSILHQCSEGRFKADHTQYKLEPLAWFFINILESSLADIEIYRKRYNDLQKLSESASTVLNCFRSSPEKRLKVGAIVKKTGIPRRTVQYALKTLTKQELLQILGRGAGSRYQLVF
ncbi:MAG: Fic family protein [Deltaproteobacteria bacterium]|jgi:Fic family protein|nr:Fic family protein [Deltaproteobacteria bacterium]